MISEISFDAAIAHGNFSVEPDPTTMAPQVKTHNLGERHDHKIEITVPNEINEPAVIAVILIGKIFIKIVLIRFLMIIFSGLTLVILLLGAIILIIYRFRNRKFFRSPNSSNIGFPNSTLPHLQPESVYGKNLFTSIFENTKF